MENSFDSLESRKIPKDVNEPYQEPQKVLKDFDDLFRILRHFH